MVCRLSLRKPYQLNILSFQPHSVNKFSIDIYANFPLFYALLLIQSETFLVTGCSLDRHFIPVQKKRGQIALFFFHLQLLPNPYRLGESNSSGFWFSRTYISF